MWSKNKKWKMIYDNPFVNNWENDASHFSCEFSFIKYMRALAILNVCWLRTILWALQRNNDRVEFEMRMTPKYLCIFIVYLCQMEQNKAKQNENKTRTINIIRVFSSCSCCCRRCELCAQWRTNNNAIMNFVYSTRYHMLEISFPAFIESNK